MHTKYTNAQIHKYKDNNTIMGQGCQGLCLKLPVTCTRVFGHQKMSEMGAQTLTQHQSDLIIGRKKFDLCKYTSAIGLL